MRIVPRHELLKKAAALRSADALGRSMAQRRANEELAKQAAFPLANILGRAKGAVVGAAKSVQTGVKNVVGKLKPVPFKATPGAGHPYRDLAKQTPASASMASGWGNAAQAKPVSIGGDVVGTVKQAPKTNVESLRSAPVQQRAVPTQEGVHSTSGLAAAGKGTPGRVVPASPATAETAPTAPAGKKKGFGWGKAALLGTAGLGVYGASKAIPWAGRQLEQSSGQAMAPNLGWSPTPYGYGSNPYGQQAVGQMNYGG